MSRIVDLTQGRVMVVTDLHGDWLAYWHYCKRFLELRAQGAADTLVFCGDLIHSDGPEAGDYSLEIVLDLIQLREELGEHLIVLMGNHEVPHLYGFPLSRGSITYTPRFERAMGEYRPHVLTFFNALPFFVRTRAGVTLTHAGASRAGADPMSFQALKRYSHAEELSLVDAMLEGQDRASLRAGISKLGDKLYAEMVAENLGITDPHHPRYDDLLRGLFVQSWSENFRHLWDALFNRNEHEYGPRAYETMVQAFLANLSTGFVPQRFLVSGHIKARGGCEIVVGRQLRLASGPHATPPEAAQYLIFDAGQPVTSIEELMRGLESVWVKVG